MTDINKPGVNKIILRSLFLFMPFFLASVITLLFFLSIYIRIDMDNINKSQQLILELQNKKTGNSFNEIFADIQFLADTDVLKNYCTNSHRNKHEPEDLLFYFVKNKRVYDQVKILDINGKEAIRVNYNNGDPIYVSEENLQDKSHSYYYQKATQLPDNTVFISELDLNYENGVPETPDKPVIRFVLPMKNNLGVTSSYLVFNYNANNLIDGIRDHESISYGLIMLLNKQSQWIISNERKDEMAFSKGDERGFKDIYPDIWQKMYLSEKGKLTSEAGIFYYTTLRPVPTLASENSETIDLSLSAELKYMPTSYEWKLVTYVPQNFLTSRYAKVSNFAYVIFGFVNIAFVIACIIIATIRLNSKYRDAVYKNMLEEYVEELKRKRSEMQTQVMETQELVHILCHDLVNPIGCVMGMMDLYHEDNSDEYKELIDDSLEQAISIINMVRTMRALDSGKKEMDIVSVNLAKSVETSTRILGHRFKDKNITANVAVGKNINVMADPTSLINSVINNLLTNALKFSPSGSTIDISASVKGDKVEVIINDHGEGMPESIAENLFNPIKPTTRPGTEGESGTGFGMPLVYKFITVYGGEIRVDSTEKTDSSTDHGTSIILTFRNAD